MAKAKNVEAASFGEIFQKYIYGYQLTAEESRQLKTLFASRPELKRQLDERKKEWAKGSSASHSAARGKSSLKSKLSEGGYTTLPGLNRNLQSSYYGGRSVVSPGGFKKSGFDEDSQVRRAGLVTDQRKGANTAKYFKDGSAEFNGRKYSKSQVDAIVRRGTSGATMGVADQSIYDRYMQIRRDKAERDENAKEQRKMLDAQRFADAAQAEKSRQSAVNRLKALAIGNGMPYAEYLKSLGLDEESAANLSAEELTAHEEVLKRRNAALDEQAKLKAKTEYENELKRQQQNAQYGLPEDTPLLDNLQLKEIAKGTKAWARDPKAVKRIEEQKAEIMRLFENNEIDEAKRDELLGRLGSQLDAIPYGYVDNPNRRTTSQILAEANDNGGFYIDDDGKLQQIESKKDLREQNAQKAIEKLDNARQNKLWEILRKEEEAYNKAHKTDEEKITDEDGKEIDNPYYGKSFDYKARLPQLRAQMDEIFGGAPQEDVPQAGMDDLANLSTEANAQFADENADAIVCPECGATFTGDVCPVCGWYAGSAEERNLEAFQNGDEPEFAEEPEAPARHVKKSYL